MANAQEDGIVMEIETRLKEDQDGSLRSSLAAGIDEQIAGIDAALKKGVPPAEYERLSTLRSGLESAGLILDRTWSHYHR